MQLHFLRILQVTLPKLHGRVAAQTLLLNEALGREKYRRLPEVVYGFEVGSGQHQDV